MTEKRVCIPQLRRSLDCCDDAQFLTEVSSQIGISAADIRKLRIVRQALVLLQVAVLAGLFVVLHFGLKGWQYWHYKQVESALDAQITHFFQQAMPGAPVPEPLQARRQIEMRLNQLRGTAPASGMMVTLAALSDALAQTPDTTVEAIAYRNNTTDVRLLAPSVDALDRIRQVATEKGLDAKIQSASPRESKFEGRLQFTSTGA